MRILRRLTIPAVIQKAEGRKQKAVGDRAVPAFCFLPSAFCLLPYAYCLLVMNGPSANAGPPVISAPAGDEPFNSGIYRPGEKEAGGNAPIRLRAGPHLFVDDFLVESCANVARRVNRPARDPAIPNPIITGKEDRNFQPFMTVLRDPKTLRFRIWYGIWKESKDAGSSHIGYMESEDGIRWIRPVRVLEDPAPLGA